MATRKEQLGIDLRHNVGDFEDTKTGDISRIDGLENLNQWIYHTLLTVKGTLAHRPDYGVGIKTYQGAIAGLDQQRNLALSISNELEKDGRVTSVDRVQFIVDDNRPDLFKIFVKYSALGYNELSETFDPFELGV